MSLGKAGVALLTAFAFMTATTVVPAVAGDYHKGGGGYHKSGGYHKGHGKGGYHKGHGHGHGKYHKRKKNKDWVPFAIIGGIAAVAIIASQANKKKKHDDDYYEDDGYYKSKGGYHKGKGGYHKGHGGYQKANAGGDNCHVVYKTEKVRGRYVKKGCTICYNPDGSAYIVEGSEFVVGYVD